MKGNNELRLCMAQVKEILEKYITNELHLEATEVGHVMIDSSKNILIIELIGRE